MLTVICIICSALVYDCGISKKCLSDSNLTAVQIFHVPECQHWIAARMVNFKFMIASVTASLPQVWNHRLPAYSVLAISHNNASVVTVVPVQQLVGRVDCGQELMSCPFRPLGGS